MPSLSPKTTPLTRAQAAHLLRRTTFGPTKQLIESYTGMSVADAVQQLLQIPSSPPAPPLNPLTGIPWVIENTDPAFGSDEFIYRSYLRTWWIEQMMNVDTIIEKMVFFMHSHFTIKDDKVLYSTLLYHQNALFRLYALGNFKALVKKICTDLGMSLFLDNYTNVVGEPNENFGRELLELYTIGKGPQIGVGDYTTYTEEDVVQAARVLTGHIIDINQLGVDTETGLLRTTIFPILHDSGDKIFSDKFQETTITGGSDVVGVEAELDAMIEMIFAQDATAEFIVRKLYRYFVFYKIDAAIEQDIIQALAQVFRDNNYELLPVITQLLNSQHFFDEDDAIGENNIVGSIVKSPIDLTISIGRYFNWPMPDMTAQTEDYYLMGGYLNAFAENCQMLLFNPPEVAGWPAYHQEPGYHRNWMSATTIVNRYVFAYFIYLNGIELSDGQNIKINPVEWIDDPANISDPYNPNTIIEELTQDLFPQGADTDRINGLKNTLLDGFPDVYWTAAWGDYKNNGDDSVVAIRLSLLFYAILQSPELQLC